MTDILITDDSPLFAKAHAQMLRRAGYHTMHAENGYEALIMAKEKMPDAVLMDVVMPVMNGFQAVRQFSKDEGLKHIPIIMTSTKAGINDAIWARRQGAAGYLVKPVVEEQLLATIRHVLSGTDGFTLSGIWKSPEFS